MIARIVAASASSTARTGLAAQHDALERVEIDLVELAALGAEADRQQRDQASLAVCVLAMPSASSFTPAGRSAGSVGVHDGEEADLGRGQHLRLRLGQVLDQRDRAGPVRRALGDRRGPAITGM